VRRRFRRPIARGIVQPDRRVAGGSVWVARRALATVLLVVLAVPWLAGFGTTTSFREPGLLPGGPDESPFTLADLARLRSQPAPPQISARSAIVWDASAGQELYSKAPDERIAPASTTKMLTALLTLELVPLATQITVDERDISLPEYDESSMNLLAGETLTAEDLLHGALMVSGGDAARVLARRAGTTLLGGAAGDPMARFMQEMNARVAKWGLKNTHFVNPDGGDAPEHYSSARDLLRIADEALKRPEFVTIVGTQATTRQTVDGSRVYNLTNSNQLLFQRPGVHGVKTGTTDACGQCLVVAQWGIGGRIMAVVLGSTDRYADATLLLDWVNAAYRWVPVGQGADLPGLAAALNRWQVTFRDRKLLVLQAWEAPTLRYQLLLEPGASGEQRGRVAFYAGRREVASLPVYAR
jgi:serine-type D-Ala-D-Ala carboxypeptidase (penicillin-binding protein 5/6)